MIRSSNNLKIFTICFMVVVSHNSFAMADTKYVDGCKPISLNDAKIFKTPKFSSYIVNNEFVGMPAKVVINNKNLVQYMEAGHEAESCLVEVHMDHLEKDFHLELSGR